MIVTSVKIPNMENKEIIDIEDFAKIEMRAATITSVEEIPGSDKLLKLQVDFGTEQRQILSGIKKWYAPIDLVGIKTLFVTNLKPRKMMGLESQGMLMALDRKDDEAPLIIKLGEEVANGDFIR